jgi:hypothetical protein
MQGHPGKRMVTNMYACDNAGYVTASVRWRGRSEEVILRSSKVEYVQNGVELCQLGRTASLAGVDDQFFEGVDETDGDWLNGRRTICAS